MNHRRIIRRSLLATLTTLSLLPITVANAADADGTLLWGIRSSFNNYTHGPTKLTDVEREINTMSCNAVDEELQEERTADTNNDLGITNVDTDYTDESEETVAAEFTNDDENPAYDLLENIEDRKSVV